MGWAEKFVASAKPGGRFPTTRWTLVRAAQEDEAVRRDALELLFSLYWKPVYFYLRRRGMDPARAEDAVQGFFTDLLERGFPLRADPARGRLRSYLRAAMDHYLINQHAREKAVKRGGGSPSSASTRRAPSGTWPVPQGTLKPPTSRSGPWRCSAAPWIACAESTSRATAGVTRALLRFFEFDEAAPSYADAAAECGMPVARFKATLHRARVRFRELLREEVAQTTPSGGAIEAEMATSSASSAADRRERNLSPFSATTFRGSSCIEGREAECHGGGAVSAVCPRCGAANPGGRFVMCPACLMTSELAPPALADTYEILEQVGQGGMGTVYRARHRRLDRTVALKFLDEPLAAESDFHERLETEGRAMARLEHPHIVAVYDLGREAGHSYIAMEFVEGLPLSHKIPMPLSRALLLADQVCDALAYAHERGVVHCDVKPENILLDCRGNVKVSDFGVARILEGSALAGAVSRKLVMGTRAYMAPETLAGAPPDPRMDVYSLGIVLYEMVTGMRPDAQNPPEGTLAPILRKALARDPRDRHASIADLRRALWRLTDSEVLHEPTPEEARLIRIAAAGAAVVSVVGLRGVEWGVRTVSRVQAGLTAPVSAVLDAPAAIVIGAAALTLVVVHLLDARLRDTSRAPAPPDYEALYAERAGPWGLAAVLLVLLRAGLERMAPDKLLLREAAGPLALLGDLFQLGALFWAWSAVFDARRVRQTVVGNATLVTGILLAAAATLVDFVLMPAGAP